jgi:hypothetical protein
VGLIELLEEHSDEFGEGVSRGVVSALEAKLDIKLPEDFREYLIKFNYAEIYGDPIFGINHQMTHIDIYTQNKHEDHFYYGFVAIFTNDIDGTIFIRPDSGAIYNASYSVPLAKNFTEFVRMILANDS